jgi:hypothetical protein
MTTGPGAHSPVGASAIKRVLACPASVSLAYGIEDEESDHAALGTAVHSVIEEAFRRNIDAWQLVGSKTCEDYPINKTMANSAQVMLDAVRKAHLNRNQGNFWVERRFHCPTIHPLFYGTSDVVFLEITADGRWIIHIWDYKNGAGVVVEVEENPQLMYYACGALEDLGLWDKVETVVLHVVQPNGFHYDGPVRSWSTTPDHLTTWLEDVLVPGIAYATDQSNDGLPRLATSGEHCRFCPARTHACPQLMSDVDELEALMAEIEKKGADALTGEQLARFLHLKETAKIVFKAAESTAFKRIQGGARIDGWKLAKAKANRDWKEGADDAALAEFGPKAMTEPKAKSPAQIDDLPGGTTFTARWAYKPDTGLTLVKGSDTRPEVSTDTKALFKPVAPAPIPMVQPIVPPPASGGRRKALAAPV